MIILWELDSPLCAWGKGEGTTPPSHTETPTLPRRPPFYFSLTHDFTHVAKDQARRSWVRPGAGEADEHREVPQSWNVCGWFGVLVVFLFTWQASFEHSSVVPNKLIGSGPYCLSWGFLRAQRSLVTGCGLWWCHLPLSCSIHWNARIYQA